MKQFLEDILHQPIEIKKYENIKKLPLILQGNYNLDVMIINGESCILAEPKEEFGLATLRKQQRRLEQLTAMYCVLYLKNLKSYPRERMLEEGIPFIWENHQIYMPFLGLFLKKNEARMLKSCTKVSFLTQKLLLLALYNQWKNITVTEASRLLDVTKMSITRCYDEIESMDIPVIEKKGRTRLLSCCEDKKTMWKLIAPHMRNPLLYEFYMEENMICDLPRSGISALSYYSMLSDNEYMTYAIKKTQLMEFDMKNKKQIPKGENYGCVIQELGYVINYKGTGIIDPLTVLLLMDAEREDPRIDIAIEAMLEEYVW